MSCEYQVSIFLLRAKPEGFVYLEKFTARITTAFTDTLIPSIPMGNYSGIVKLVNFPIETGPDISRNTAKLNISPGGVVYIHTFIRFWSYLHKQQRSLRRNYLQLCYKEVFLPAIFCQDSFILETTAQLCAAWLPVMLGPILWSKNSLEEWLQIFLLPENPSLHWE